MTHLIIAVISFTAGYLIKGAMLKEDRQIYKNHRDVINWLKSDLAREQMVKLTKIANSDKVRFLKLLIKRLNKNL